jgi:type III pantothenate kinase
MILAVDVGNTNIVLGGVRTGKGLFRPPGQRQKQDREQYALEIQGILAMRGVAPAEIEGGILSSVVPYLQTVLPRAIRLLTGLDILVVGPGIRTG